MPPVQILLKFPGTSREHPKLGHSLQGSEEKQEQQPRKQSLDIIILFHLLVLNVISECEGTGVIVSV